MTSPRFFHCVFCNFVGSGGNSTHCGQKHSSMKALQREEPEQKADPHIMTSLYQAATPSIGSGVVQGWGKINRWEKCLEQEQG